MPEYSVNVNVAKQLEHEACWASICAAVVEVLQPGANPSPDTLYQQWKSATNKAAQDPKKVLDADFGIACNVSRYKAAVTTPVEKDQRALDMETVVVDSLSQGVPVICGLTTYDDAPLAAGPPPIHWLHAGLIYKCDTVRNSAGSSTRRPVERTRTWRIGSSASARWPAGSST